MVVTCLVLSPFGRPYCCKNRTVGRSRRHLVDFVTTAVDANPPRFSCKLAKVRSCDLHLCSISLRMCPPSSKIDRSRSLMCPKRSFECQKHTNLCFTQAKLMSVEGNSCRFPLRGGAKEPLCGTSCACKTLLFAERIALEGTKVLLVRS